MFSTDSSTYPHLNPVTHNQYDLSTLSAESAFLRILVGIWDTDQRRNVDKTFRLRVQIWKNWKEKSSLQKPVDDGAIITRTFCLSNCKEGA